MKRYYSIESTPLSFHKAFYKVISPFIIVLQSILLLATIGHLISDDGYYDSGALVLNLFIYVLGIVFLGFMTYGFANKKEYAWYMVYAYFGLNVLINIISAAPMLYYNPAYALGQIIGALIIPILIGIYYYKRKPLFVASEFNNGAFTNNETVTTNYMPQNSVSSSPMEKRAMVSFCRKCGNRVTNDSVFCNKCGSKITWD